MELLLPEVQDPHLDSCPDRMRHWINPPTRPILYLRTLLATPSTPACESESGRGDRALVVLPILHCPDPSKVTRTKTIAENYLTELSEVLTWAETDPKTGLADYCSKGQIFRLKELVGDYADIVKGRMKRERD